MRRLAAFAALSALAMLASCRPEPEGAVKVLVIGGAPTVRDPADGPIAFPEHTLLQ